MPAAQRLRSAVRDVRLARPRSRLPAAVALPLLVAVSFLCGYELHDRMSSRSLGAATDVAHGPGSPSRRGFGLLTAPGSNQRHNGQCYADAVAAAQAVAVNDTVILTVVNQAMLDFGRNWVAHLTAAGASNMLVGVYERTTANALSSAGVPCLDISDVIQLDANATFSWGDTNWRRTSWSRCSIIPEIMRGGFHVVWSDIDVVWFRDPTGMLPLHPEVDMIMGSDQLATSLPPGDAGFEDPAFAFQHQYNAGVTFLRHSRQMIDLMDAWKVEMNAGRQKMNQDALNKELLRAGLGKANVSRHLAPDNQRVLLAFRRRVRLGVLPIQVLMTGRSYCLQRLDRALGVRPWSLHLTWVTGSQDGKRYRLQEAGLWRGEPRASPHYGRPTPTSGAPPERFLAMDIVHPQIPYDLAGAPLGEWKNNAAMMEAYHVAAINFQLAQIWYGWSIAALLNRTFVIPKMACFVDHNWWRPRDGRSTGAGPRPSDFPLPYGCPADFIWEPHYLTGPARFKGTNTYLPPLPHRVHSFLADAQLDPDVRASQLRVRTTTAVECKDCAHLPTPQHCTAGPRPLGAGSSGNATVLRSGKVVPLETRCIPAGMDSWRLGTMLRQYDGVRVLHLGDSPRMWGGWHDIPFGDKVQARMDVALHEWVGRTTHAAVQTGRNHTEPYTWRPFSSVAEVYDKAVDSSGVIDVARVLAESVKPWWVDNYQFQFKGAQVPSSMWP